MCSMYQKSERYGEKSDAAVDFQYIDPLKDNVHMKIGSCNI